jgi:hypothetical protein
MRCQIVRSARERADCMRMTELLRKAHGAGAPALLRVETPPIDELAAPNASDTVQGLAEAKRRGRPFEKGNVAAKGRKPMLAGLGLDASDPRYRRALKKAERLRQRRVRELAVMHGGYLSAGVAAMLGSSARALASSLVLHELADERLKAGTAKANREAANLLAQAARLADSSRQQELTALAIAEREAKSRPAHAGDIALLLSEPAEK